MHRLYPGQIHVVLSALSWTFAALPSWAEDKNDEATEIAKLVQESQRSGRERGDFAAFMAIWAPDAKLIAARSEKPDKFDSEMTLAQVEALARLKYRGLPAAKDVKFEFVDVHVDIAKDKAVLRYRSILKQDGVTGSTDEIYRLRKTEGKWKVYENRFWPVETRSAAKTIQYTATAWNQLDAEVEKHKRDKNVLQQTIALLEAWRFREAHALAKTLTQESKEDAVAWLVRGDAALAAADAEDALASFRRALQIDDKAEVPHFIRGAIVRLASPDLKAAALAPLSRFAGTWEKRFTICKSEWSPEEQAMTGTHLCQWILDDTHLQETGRDSDGGTYTGIYSYDVAAKEYSLSAFQSNGNSWRMSGKWDARTSTFTWQTKVEDGVRMEASYQLVSPDEFKFSYVVKKDDGKVFFRLEGTGKRVEAPQEELMRLERLRRLIIHPRCVPVESETRGMPHHAKAQEATIRPDPEDAR